MKRLLLAALLFGASGAAEAHEVWIERDGKGPVRIYLGEPGDVLPEGGDPEFVKLKAPRLVSAPNAALVRKAGYLEAEAPAGDVRAWDDNVFVEFRKTCVAQGVGKFAAKLPEFLDFWGAVGAFYEERFSAGGKFFEIDEFVANGFFLAVEFDDNVGFTTAQASASGAFLGRG